MNYIRDAVHSYIAISSFEEQLLNHPTVFRLNRVLQNSTFFHTYPFNRGSRFIHSIGTMHVAGKLCEHIFRNSNLAIIDELVEVVRSVFELGGHIPASRVISANNYIYQIQHDEEDDLFDTLGWMVDEIKDESASVSIRKVLSPNLVKLLIYQGARLAALVHDIGHPPYSHVVEFAYQDLEKVSGSLPDALFSQALHTLNSRYEKIISSRTLMKDIKIKGGKLHEKIGLVLISNIFDGIYPRNHDERKPGQEFFELSLSICVLLIAIEQNDHYTKRNLRLAIKHNPMIAKLYPFASIISGPVDSDRLDYMVRDAINSAATEFIGFDYEKIIQNISVERYPNLKPRERFSEIWAERSYKDNLLLPVFHRRAYSTLADFFYSKMHQYRWLIGHHNVVRTDIALSRTMFYLGLIYNEFNLKKYIEISDTEVKAINKFLAENDFYLLMNFADPTPPDVYKRLEPEERLEHLLENYRYIDDSWLDTFLQEFHQFLERNELDIVYSPLVNRIIQYLKILYERKTEYLQAIWKREDGFEYFAEGFVALLSDRSRKISKWYNEDLKLTENKRKFPLLAEFLNKEVVDDLSLTESSSHLIRGVNKILHAWKVNRDNLESPYTAMLRIENKLTKDFPEYKIVFCLKNYSPYEQVSIVLDETGKKELRTLDSISQITKKLDEITGGQLQLYAFDYSGRDGEWEPEKISDLGKAVANVILQDVGVT